MSLLLLLLLWAPVDACAAVPLLLLLLLALPPTAWKLGPRAPPPPRPRQAPGPPRPRPESDQPCDEPPPPVVLGPPSCPAPDGAASFAAATADVAVPDASARTAPCVLDDADDAARTRGPVGGGKPRSVAGGDPAWTGNGIAAVGAGGEWATC